MYDCQVAVSESGESLRVTISKHTALRAKHLLVVLFWCKSTNIWSVFVSMSVSTKDLQLSNFSFNLHSTMNPSAGWRCTFIVMQQVHMVFVIHINVPLHSRWQTSYHQLATNQRPRDTSDIVHLAACMVQASLTGGQSLLPLVDNTNTTCSHSRFGWLVHQQVTIYKLRSTPPSILHCTKVKSAHFHFPPAISTPIRERQYEQCI